MQEHDRSERRAREILKRYVDSIIECLSQHVEALFLVGSLSNGSYVEGPGRGYTFQQAGKKMVWA